MESRRWGMIGNGLWGEIIAELDWTVKLSYASEYNETTFYVYFTNIINLALHRELSRTIETIRCQWDFDFLLEFNKKSNIALQCEF